MSARAHHEYSRSAAVPRSGNTADSTIQRTLHRWANARFLPQGKEAAVSGNVAARFEGVLAAFLANFQDYGEVGAALAVFHRGAKVVDLWGGRRTRSGQMAWQETTLAPLQSSGGAIAAACCAVAHSRGWLRFDHAVAGYWPEFAQAGKCRITVRQLLSGQAGLCMISPEPDGVLLNDSDALAKLLAAQVPRWKPGSRHGYHGASLDLYVEQLLRRCDPKQRTLGDFFREEIALPLDLDVHAGCSKEVSARTLAQLDAGSWWHWLDRFETYTPQFVLASLSPGSMTQRSLKGLMWSRAPTGRPGSGAATPTLDGLATARGLAGLYSAFLNCDPRLGLQAGTLAELEKPAAFPWQGDRDMVLKKSTAYALGFWKPCRNADIGIDGRAYGHVMIGGGLSFADPGSGLAFSYLPNSLGPYLFGDPRVRALVNATYSALERA